MSSKFLVISDFYSRINYYKKQKLCIVTKAQLNDLYLPKYVSFSNALTIEKLLKGFSSTKIRNRCVMTGRSRAVFNKFRMTRMAFKYMSLHGLINGVNKYSW
jgi:ribosomal protein S14